MKKIDLTGTIHKLKLISIISFWIFLSTGCKKLLELDVVQNKTQSELVFSDQKTANDAINGIYRQATENLQSSISTYGSFVADELTPTSLVPPYDIYYKNQIPSNDANIPWASFYKIIYSCNAAIEGLTSNVSVNVIYRNQYIGEAKFNRAFCYMYLVNIFGDVPLVTTTNVQTNTLITRSSSSVIYEQIKNDLSDAIMKLQPDYSFNGLGKSRANKWAAVALLARVNLYMKDYKAAEYNASLVINSGLYSLMTIPTRIYVKDNIEAILQWAFYNGEQNELANNASLNPPGYTVSNKLFNSFESTDLRKLTWIGNKVISGQTFYFPFKFTITGPGSDERYTVLRLAEQYLIRAEAEAFQNNFADAIADVNVIRLKHGGLTHALSVPISQTDCLDLILHERYLEFFNEGMHRWFDLKRTNKLDETMIIEKPGLWKSTAALYPIPLSDLQKNPNLRQNPGYE